MWLRMKNCNIFGVHWKVQFLEGAHEKPIQRKDCLKRGAWTVCRFKAGLGKKEESGVFKGGWRVDTSMHNVLKNNLLYKSQESNAGQILISNLENKSL